MAEHSQRSSKAAALRLLRGVHDVPEASMSSESANDTEDSGASDSEIDESGDASSASASDEDTGLSTSRTMIMTSVDGEKWTSIPPQEQLRGRERRENLLRPAPRLTNYALRNVRDPNIIMDSWEILFNHDMVET